MMTTAIKVTSLRELDQLVAEKVMGWQWHPWFYNSNQLVLAPNKSFASSLAFWGKDVTHNVPHYSTDIAAAWEIVEKLGADLCFQIDNVGFPPNKWRCLFGWSDNPVTGEAEDESPRVAICLAALKTVGIEVELELPD